MFYDVTIDDFRALEQADLDLLEHRVAEFAVLMSDTVQERYLWVSLFPQFRDRVLAMNKYCEGKSNETILRARKPNKKAKPHAQTS